MSNSWPRRSQRQRRPALKFPFALRPAPAKQLALDRDQLQNRGQLPGFCSKLKKNMSAGRRRSKRAISQRRIHRIGTDDDSSEEDHSDVDTALEVSSSDEESEGTFRSTDEEDTSEEEPDPAVFQRDLLIAPDGTTWAKSLPTVPIEAWRSAFVNFHDGPRGAANRPGNEGISKCSIFSMFLTENVQKQICNWTNKQGVALVDHYNARHSPQKAKTWKDVTPLELQALFGLIYLLGIEKGKKKPVHELWSKEAPVRSIPFVATMSRGRFQDILAALRFDDAQERHRLARLDPEAYRRRDKFVPFREVFDSVVCQFQELYEPGSKICIDEQLIKFRGRCPFRVYMPDKPGKYGIRVWAMVDNASEYILKLQVYEGRPVNQDGVRQTQRNLGESVVLELARKYEGTGRGIVADNFFSSLSLVQQLLAKKLTFCGTIRKNRREIPYSLKIKSLHSEDNVFVFKHDEQITLLRHNCKGKKYVLLISSAHYSPQMVTISRPRGEKTVPEIIDSYNCNKYSVDAADYMVASYTGQFPSRRWPIKLFVHLLDCIAINAFIIFTKNDPNWKSGTKGRRRLFIRELAYELILPAIRKRVTETPNLPEFVRSAISSMGVTHDEQVAAVGRFYKRKAAQISTGPSTAIAASSSQTQSTGSAEDESSRSALQDQQLHPHSKRCRFDSPIVRHQTRSDFPCNKCGTYICSSHRVTVCPDCAQTHGLDIPS